MIRLTLEPWKLPTGSHATLPDRATAEWQGQTYQAISAHGASMAVARQLVAAGCPDQPWEACAPDIPSPRSELHSAAPAPGQRLLFGPSLHGLAKLTISEGAGRIKAQRYQAPPEGFWQVRDAA